MSIRALYREHNNAARTLQSCAACAWASIACTQPGASEIPWDGIPFKCSANTVARHTQRVQSAHPLAPFLPSFLSLFLFSPDNVFCERDASAYGRGGAAFYRFYIAQWPSTKARPEWRIFTYQTWKRNAANCPRSRYTDSPRDKLIIFLFLYFSRPLLSPIAWLSYEKKLRSLSTGR